MAVAKIAAGNLTTEEIGKKLAEEGGEYRPEVTHVVPERYGDPAKSGLTATVSKEGPNEFTFDIK